MKRRVAKRRRGICRVQRVCRLEQEIVNSLNGVGTVTQKPTESCRNECRPAGAFLQLEQVPQPLYPDPRKARTYEIPITNDNNNNNNNQRDNPGGGFDSGGDRGTLGANNNNNNGGGLGGETGDPTIRIPREDAEDKAINIVIKVDNNNNNNNNNDDPETGEAPSNNNNNGGGGGHPSHRSYLQEGDVCACPRGSSSSSQRASTYGQAMRQMNAAGAHLAAPTPAVVPVANPVPPAQPMPLNKHGHVDPIAYIAQPVTADPLSPGLAAATAAAASTTIDPHSVLPPNQFSTTTYYRMAHKLGAGGEVLTDVARKAIEFCQSNVRTKGSLGDIEPVLSSCCQTKCATDADQFKCKQQCKDYFGHLMRKVLKAVTASADETTAKDVVF